MGEMGTSASPLRRVAMCGAAFLTGCNLLTGASDLEIGANSVPSTGGGDAQADGRVTPVGDGGGGGSDAATDGDAGAVAPQCTPLAVFCDDFDGKTGLSKWGTIAIGGGSANIDSVAAVSPPSSLLMTWPTAGQNTVGVALQAGTGVTPKSAALNLSMRLEATDDSEVTAVELLLGPSYAIRLKIRKAGDLRLEEATTLDAGGTATGTSLSRRLALGGPFQTVSIALTLDNAPSAAVQIDGQAAGTKALSPPASKGALSIVLGDSNVTSTSQPLRIRYDNVVVIAH